MSSVGEIKRVGVNMKKKKRFYASKTLWVNLIAIVAIIANSVWGFEIDAEAQAAMATGILAVVNIALRLVTNQPVSR